VEQIKGAVQKNGFEAQQSLKDMKLELVETQTRWTHPEISTGTLKFALGVFFDFLYDNSVFS
jgi:hypothetical protein